LIAWQLSNCISFGIKEILGLRIQGGHHSKFRDGCWSGLAPDGYRNMEERTEHAERLEYGKYKHWVEADPEQFSVWRRAWELLLTDCRDNACVVRLFLPVHTTGRRGHHPYKAL